MGVANPENASPKGAMPNTTTSVSANRPVIPTGSDSQIHKAAAMPNTPSMSTPSRGRTSVPGTKNAATRTSTAATIPMFCFVKTFCDATMSFPFALRRPSWPEGLPAAACAHALAHAARRPRQNLSLIHI